MAGKTISVFGLRLRQIRELAKLTQVQLAERAGTSRSAVCMIEKGHRSASFDLVRRLAQALHVTTDDFCTSSEK